MTRITIPVLLATTLLAGTAMAQTTPPAATTNGAAATAASAQQLDKQDQSFIHNAAIGGMAEVELGKLAQEKASDPSVKDFGKHMVDDHSKANDRLASVAKDLKVTVPTALDAKNKETVDKLSKLSGAQFDRAYMDDMVKDHQEDIAEFQKEASAGQNAQLKSFAMETLPTLQQHLKMAQDAQAKVTSAPATAKSNSTTSSGAAGNAPSSTGGMGR